MSVVIQLLDGNLVIEEASHVIDVGGRDRVASVFNVP